MALPKLGAVGDINVSDYVTPAGPAATAQATPQPASGAAYKTGKILGKVAKVGARLGGPLAAGATLAEGLLGEGTVPNAIRTGVGLGAVANPKVGVPLATGMVLGDAVTSFFGNRLIDKQVAANDVRGPETMKFLARGGGVQTTTQGAEAAPAIGGEISSATAPVEPPVESVAVPPAVQPRPALISGGQPAVLPGANVYQERPGVRGIGGVRGVGNTEVSGTPQNMNNVGNIAGNFFGATLGLKQIAGDNLQKLAQQKATAANLAAQGTYLSAQGTYARGAAALGRTQTAQQLSAEYLRQHPGDFAGAGAVLAGRNADAGMKPTIPMGGVGLNPTKDPSLVFDPRTKTTSLVYPTQNITMAQAVASAKKNGTYKSDAQVRADLAKMSQYKLTE